MKHVPKYLMPRVGAAAATTVDGSSQNNDGGNSFVPFRKTTTRGRGRGRGGRGFGGSGRGGKKKSDPLKKFGRWRWWWTRSWSVLGDFHRCGVLWFCAIYTLILLILCSVFDTSLVFALPFIPVCATNHLKAVYIGVDVSRLNRCALILHALLHAWILSLSWLPRYLRSVGYPIRAPVASTALWHKTGLLSCQYSSRLSQTEYASRNSGCVLVSTTTHGIKDRDKSGGGLKAFKTYVYIIVTIYSVLSSVTSAEQNPAWRCLTLLLVSLRLQNELQRDLGQVRIKSLYVFLLILDRQISVSMWYFSLFFKSQAVNCFYHF